MFVRQTSRDALAPTIIGFALANPAKAQVGANPAIVMANQVHFLDT
ncbi:MAG: hypothetical protein KF903_13365 [Dokdonella sp.]|nr:hypothetical protein [Dokdonella sp.]MBX3701975.1 hypothetical protein [Dokdonella sp.]